MNFLCIGLANFVKQFNDFDFCLGFVMLVVTTLGVSGIVFSNGSLLYGSPILMLVSFYTIFLYETRPWLEEESI